MYIILFLYIIEFFHSLTQHGSGDSIEERFTNFAVQIDLEALNPHKDDVL